MVASPFRFACAVAASGAASGKRIAKPLRIAEVDVLDPLVQVRRGARVRGDEAREALLERLPRLVAAELEHDAVAPAAPARRTARESVTWRRLGPERRDELAEREVAARHLALGPRRAVELRQLAVDSARTPRRACSRARWSVQRASGGAPRTAPRGGPATPAALDAAHPGQLRRARAARPRAPGRRSCRRCAPRAPRSTAAASTCAGLPSTITVRTGRNGARTAACADDPDRERGGREIHAGRRRRSGSARYPTRRPPSITVAASRIRTHSASNEIPAWRAAIGTS